MIEFLAVQVRLKVITIEQVPERYQEEVRKRLEVSS